MIFQKVEIVILEVMFGKRLTRIGMFVNSHTHGSIQETKPHIACAGQVGFVAIFKQFSGLQFILLPGRVHAHLPKSSLEDAPRPCEKHTGRDTSRWALIFYDSIRDSNE